MSPRKRRRRSLGVRGRYSGAVHKKVTQSSLPAVPTAAPQSCSRGQNTNFRLVKLDEIGPDLFSSRGTLIFSTKTPVATSGSAGKVLRGCAQKNDTIPTLAKDFGELSRAKNQDFSKKKSTKVVGSIFPQGNNSSTKGSRRATLPGPAGSYRTVLHKKLTQSHFLGTKNQAKIIKKQAKIIKKVILDFCP